MTQMEVTLQDAKTLAAGVYEVEADPIDLALFGKPLQQFGSVSLLQVTGEVPLIDGSRLSFDHKEVRVLNQGTSRRAILVTESAPPTQVPTKSGSVETTGDRRFLGDLPGELRSLGEALLKGVRAEVPGELEFRNTSGKYVNRPDNFWTVKIQPRDGSLRLTVRGRPEVFGQAIGLDIADDMAGYSRFKIKVLSQVPAAIDVILRARRR